jgi:hypothetical protein
VFVRIIRGEDDAPEVFPLEGHDSTKFCVTVNAGLQPGVPRCTQHDSNLVSSCLGGLITQLSTTLEQPVISHQIPTILYHDTMLDEEDQSRETILTHMHAYLAFARSIIKVWVKVWFYLLIELYGMSCDACGHSGIRPKVSLCPHHQTASAKAKDCYG